MYKQIPFDIQSIICRYVHRYNMRMLNEYDIIFKSHLVTWTSYNNLCSYFFGVCLDLKCEKCRCANYRKLFLCNKTLGYINIFKMIDIMRVNPVAKLPKNY